jgi:hypothetical protein
MRIISLIITLLLSFSVSAETKSTLFTGRVAKVNEKSGIVRIKSKFVNLKYVNKRDKIYFWDYNSGRQVCKSYVLGKSPKYLLLKVPEFAECSRGINLAIGNYINISSKDLTNNLIMGRALINLLLKKRVAITSKVRRSKKYLDTHVSRIDAINGRYTVLREKLEREWKKELAALDEDQVTTLHNYKDLNRRLNEVDFKIEKYRVGDQNLEEDRWSLDSRLYFKK